MMHTFMMAGHRAFVVQREAGSLWLRSWLVGGT